MPDPTPKKAASNHASFAVPRAAIDALIDTQADAVTIGAYLVLACHTDASGQFSTASKSAVQKYVGGGKDRFNRGRSEKAITNLCTSEAKHESTQRSKSKRKLVIQPPTPTVPLVYTRNTWLEKHGGDLPDGPKGYDKAQVHYILPTFDEPLKDRVWIGSDLVYGTDLIELPLKQLKDCGDVAARLLLALYAGQDLDRWYGVPPHGFPWNYYTLGEGSLGQFRILHASIQSTVGSSRLFKRINPQDEKSSQVCFDAIKALQSAGFLYEAVVLLNRNPIPDQFNTGAAYGNISPDAEILCDLGSPSLFGPVSEVEQGLGKEYVDTLGLIAKQTGYADAHVYLTTLSKSYDHYDYLALVPAGQPAMIAGFFRLRFRVTHYKNAFTEEVTSKHLDANRAALKMLNYLRVTKNLEPLIRTLQSSSIPSQSSPITLNSLQGGMRGKGLRGTQVLRGLADKEPEC